MNHKQIANLHYECDGYHWTPDEVDCCSTEGGGTTRDGALLGAWFAGCTHYRDARGTVRAMPKRIVAADTICH